MNIHVQRTVHEPEAVRHSVKLYTILQNVAVKQGKIVIVKYHFKNFRVFYLNAINVEMDANFWSSMFTMPQVQPLTPRVSFKLREKIIYIGLCSRLGELLNIQYVQLVH